VVKNGTFVNMKSKWRIKGIDNYVFGEDKKLYRLPYNKDKRGYSIREIKLQNKNRYRINNQWYSHKQLLPKLYLDESPIVLFYTNEMPF